MKHKLYTYRWLIAVLFLLQVWMPAVAQHAFKNLMHTTDPSFFKTDEARQVGDQLLLYQRVTGGWPKNIDMSQPVTDEERTQLLKDKQKRDDSTTDNDATTIQMIFLARLYQYTRDPRYREGFRKGVAYHQAQAADRLKTSFLHNMTNQMLPPVQIVSDRVNELCHMQTMGSQEMDRMADDIQKQGEVITELLNHLLELSKESTGKEERHE